MHADELEIDESLVRRLLAAQFPRWADLPIARVQSAGTENALYRLGSDLVVRLPRIEAATAQVDKEHRWLPRLAPTCRLPSLSLGLIALPYYRPTNPVLASIGRRAIDEVLADQHRAA